MKTEPQLNLIGRATAHLIFIFSITALSGCDLVKNLQFKNSVDITATFDRAPGRYHPLPTSLSLTFPGAVDMTSVTSSIFTVTDDCASGTVALETTTVLGAVATLTFSGTSSCGDGETFTIDANLKGLTLTDSNSFVSKNATYKYTLDTSATSVGATINAVSGITSGDVLTFGATPAFATFAFSSDTDFESVTAADFVVVAPTTGTSCAIRPSIGTLVKDASTATVKVPLTGGTCNDTQGFKITLAASSVSDSTLNGSTGAAAANLGPATPFVINILIDTSAPPTVVSVGSGATSANGRYGIGQTVNVEITFDTSVDVTGTPRLRLNPTSSSTRYAAYVSGTGTHTLVFSYVVQPSDVASDLNYASNTALQLNGGNIARANSGGITANVTLPAPGAAGSLGTNRNIVIDGVKPTVVTSSPTGPAHTWGIGVENISFTMSEAIDPATVDVSDLTVTAGTCLAAPTVNTASVGGPGNTVLTFNLTSNSCTNTQTYTLTFNPAHVSDLAANVGAGASQTITVTTTNTHPAISVGSPSKLYLNAAGTTVYTVSYTGATAITLASGDIGFAGASTGCAATIAGTGTTTRTISITACSDNGTVQIDIASGTATNTYGNPAVDVTEASITDFTADNTALTNPTDDLALFNGTPLYLLDTQSSFNLNFAADVLDTVTNVKAALALTCDAGSGPQTVSFTAARTSATNMQISPNEAAPEFSYGATCSMNGTNVPDAAGNLHSFAGTPFVPATTPVAVSGLPPSLSISDVNSAGNLGSLVFNVPMDPSTIDGANLIFECSGNPIALSGPLSASGGNTTFLAAFNTSDANWTSLVGGETCHFTLTTAATNSLGVQLTSPLVYVFTTTP